MEVRADGQRCAPSGRAGRVAGQTWLLFVVRWLGRLMVSLWVLVTAAFLMIHLVPGDPVRAALGVTAPPDLVRTRRKALGLDDPLLVQYWHYVRGVFTADLGTSMISNLPVSQSIGDRLPATLALAGLAFVVVIAVAVLTRGGRRRGGELAFTSTSVFLAAIPEFLLAVGLVYVFGVHMQWFPVAERTDASSYVLRVLSLAIGPAAVLARIVRVEMLSVLGNDFIRTARAKWLPARLVYARRAHRHADSGRAATHQPGRGHRAGRERVRLARPRADDRPVDPAEGLPDGAGHRAGLRDRRPAGEPPRGRAACRTRSALDDPGVLMRRTRWWAVARTPVGACAGVQLVLVIALAILARVRTSENAAILLISHDITVVAQTCDRILVMYAGRFVEDIPTAELYTAPRHPYTRALLDAVPDLDTDRQAPLTIIPGRRPEPDQMPTGCAFALRGRTARPPGPNDLRERRPRRRRGRATAPSRLPLRPHLRDRDQPRRHAMTRRQGIDDLYSLAVPEQPVISPGSST